MTRDLVYCKGRGEIPSHRIRADALHWSSWMLTGHLGPRDCVNPAASPDHRGPEPPTRRFRGSGLEGSAMVKYSVELLSHLARVITAVGLILVSSGNAQAQL